MLELKNITAGYTKRNDILKGIDLTVSDNQVVAIIGQNGSGKSTIAKSIMGMVPFIHGEIYYNGTSVIGKTTAEISDLGIGFFMQGGRIFPNLTVEENLDFASSGLKKNEIMKRKSEMKEYFDLLKNNLRTKLKASYLSGGEQYQLALAMVLMKKPKLLILDEPSAGLSPQNVINLYNSLRKIKDTFLQNLLVIEQNVQMALSFCNRIIVLQEGITVQQNNILNQNIDEIEKYFFTNLNQLGD